MRVAGRAFCSNVSKVVVSSSTRAARCCSRAEIGPARYVRAIWTMMGSSGRRDG
jgi:hypothetical protein